MTIYALTVLLSAFLLFEVQPIIGKMILPWFGGSSAVWLVCLLFFQTVLLGGSLYAHLLVTRTTGRRQILIHGGALLVSLLALPILPSALWKPAGAADPTLRILGLLAATVGLPYLMLSTTSPLVQAWYAEDAARRSRAAQPYRLYALSNAGSMLALVTYPFAVEPTLTSRHQALTWSAGYLVFVLLGGLIALRRWRATTAPVAITVDTPDPVAVDPELPPAPTWADRLLWAGLPACASLLLLAITKHLTEDVAPIPLLWVLPLALYLLSFILCFEGSPWYQRSLFLPLLALALADMTWAQSQFYGGTSAKAPVALFTLGLFVCCMVCHGELQRLRPHPRHLTSFYLMVSLGGAAGGFFAALVAPQIFPGYFELPLAYVLCALLVLLALQRKPADTTRSAWRSPAWLLALVLTVAMAAYLVYDVRQLTTRTLVMARNFYGALRVEGFGSGSSAGARLLHGSTTHGEQFLTDPGRRLPISYYTPNSGVALAIRESQQRSALRVGVIGLGLGTLAAYGRPGDVYRFYEINPLVIHLASNAMFTYLKDTAATVEIAPGDARLELEREAPQQFDVLAVDAFTSDAIPIHLLTREAVALYARHLKPGGVLAVHVSNRYLDLAPVVKQLADEIGWETRQVLAPPGGGSSGSIWTLATSRAEFFADPLLAGAEAIPLRPLRTWTDDYSNLFQVLR